MRRRKYSEDYRDYREPYSPDINPLEQIARTALELQKLIGVDYFDLNHSNDDYYEPNDYHYDELEGKYFSLCISKLPTRLSDYDIRDVIYRECDCFGSDFNVKISTYNGQRVAYINFRSSKDATKARGFLREFRIDNKLVYIEPVVQKNRSPKHTRSRSPVHFYNQTTNSSYDNGIGHRSHYHRSESSHSQIQRYSSISLHNSGSNTKNSGRSRRSRSRSRSSMTNKSLIHDSGRINFNSREPGSIPTRTLFVGNLPVDVSDSELRKNFNKYGNVTDIDIKKPTSNRQTNSYAFIKFENLEIANEAKVHLSGKTLRKFQMKIGFGKVNPTNCVWVGGLGPWILYDSFEKEMSRFGVVKQISWPQNKNYAYVLYDSVDIAITAVNNLRGSFFGEEKKNIKVDFADSSCIVINSDTVSSNYKTTNKKVVSKNSRQNTEESDEGLCVKSAKTIAQLINCLNDVWTGMIVLKNNNFGCQLYMIKGERTLIEDFLSSRIEYESGNSTKVAHLAITQRMKLDPQKLAEMNQRIEAAGEHGYCLILASAYTLDSQLVSNQRQPQRPLKNLITYLRTKESAGVIFLKSHRNPSVNGAVLHAFPPCDFSFDILLQRAPNLTKDFLSDDFLVVLLIRNSGTSSN